jgi:hypothetical protein
MVRNRIFISYSHSDEALFREFMVHLKLWQDQDIYNVWTDQRIKASQNWHQEIQEAIDSTAVAVLLISPDFMVSDYIRKHEILPLTKAHEEGKLALAPLFLRPSQVTDSDYVIELTMENGESRQLRLDQFQGLNKLSETLAGKHKHTRDAIFSRAVQQIKELYKKHIREEKPKSLAADQRYELTIRLKRIGDRLIRSFYNPYEKITEGSSSWAPLQQRLATDKDAVLYEVLFGTDQENKTREVLACLFPAPDNPPRYPVRVRIQTTDPVLAGLPWTQTSWQGRRLWDDGWTFELIGEATVDFPDVYLKAPCPALLIAPQPAGVTDLGCDSHLLALEHRLDYAWPAYRQRLPHIKTRSELANTLRHYDPGIIYYYGLASGDSNTLQLRLEDTLLNITELPSLWNKPPQVLFLNLLEEQPIRLGATLSLLHAHVSLIVTQTWSSTDLVQPRQAVQAWFYTLLQGGENQDPVKALHQHGLYTALVWGRYGRWYYSPRVATAREHLARLLLNREIQRGSVLRAVSELVRDRNRRVSCVLAYGDESNLVELFAEQLLEYLRTHAKEFAHIRPLRLRLPPAQRFSADQINQQVCHDLELKPGQPLQEALRQRKPRVPERTRALLLLDWKAREIQDLSCLHEVIRAWAQFCCDQLCEHCPSDMRLLSVLALQTDKALYRVVENLISQLPAEDQLIKRSFNLEQHLPPLGPVTPGDLIRFLQRHSSCPENLIPKMPGLIFQQSTNGQFDKAVELQFDKTVELIEQAEQTTWEEMYYRLNVLEP